MCDRETKDDPSFSLSTAQANTYADPSWALSCTSKRLRRIVFDGNIERATRISFCQICCSTARAVPQHIRDNVRYALSPRTISSHLLTAVFNACSEVVVEVEAENHSYPCRCGDCEDCHQYGKSPSDLSEMLELYPNVQSLSMDWEYTGILEPRFRSDYQPRRSLDRLAELEVSMRFGDYDSAQNLLNHAADIVRHFRAPNLRKLVVTVDCLDNSDYFINGCKTLAKVICDIASPNFDSLEVNVGELRVSQLPSSPIWVSRRS
jgi:hypothetical protein